MVMVVMVTVMVMVVVHEGSDSGDRWCWYQR